VISRIFALAAGLVISAFAAFAMVAPLWYFASAQRRFFNILIALLLVCAVAAALASRIRRSRRRHSQKARVENR